MNKGYLISILGTILFFVCSCDFQRKKKCEWYFTPFPEGENAVKEGLVSICVSNFTLKKQKCYFTAQLSFLEKMNGIPFVYNDLKYTNTFPKKILSVKPCKKN